MLSNLDFAGDQIATVDVDLRYGEEALELSVTDDGKGTTGGTNGHTGGHGLVGIRERIEVLGGRVETGNRPEGGFALTIEVPA